MLPSWMFFPCDPDEYEVEYTHERRYVPKEKEREKGGMKSNRVSLRLFIDRGSGVTPIRQSFSDNPRRP
jgi:hypothetical protein